MDGMSIAAIITASVTLLGALGGGIAWVWSRVDARIKTLEDKLLEAEERERRYTRALSSYAVASELMLQELRRISPESPVLEQVTRRLAEIHEGVLA